ncbi:MAG: hypothetical protein MK189_01560 [Acidimicrobiales bacterium]|nr:hypothetical protein [Acidimicrobiales bacterium]
MAAAGAVEARGPVPESLVVHRWPDLSTQAGDLAGQEGSPACHRVETAHAGLVLACHGADQVGTVADLCVEVAAEVPGQVDAPVAEHLDAVARRRAAVHGVGAGRCNRVVRPGSGEAVAQKRLAHGGTTDVARAHEEDHRAGR